MEPPFQVGEEVWTDFDGILQKVTLIECKKTKAASGFSYRTKPQMKGATGWYDSRWFQRDKP